MIVLKKSLFDKWQEQFAENFCNAYSEETGCCILRDPNAVIGFNFANGKGDFFTVSKNIVDIPTPCEGGFGVSCSPNIVRSEGEHGNILGDSFMQGMSVIFDRENKEVAMTPVI